MSSRNLSSILIAIFALLEDDITPQQTNAWAATCSLRYATSDSTQARWVRRFEQLQLDALADATLHAALRRTVHEALATPPADDETLLLHAFIALTCFLSGELNEGTLFDVAVRLEARIAELDPRWVAEFHTFKRRQELGQPDAWLNFIRKHLETEDPTP
jgi:hypothetical protein